MKTGYYITSKGERVELEPQEILKIHGSDIVELVVPDGVLQVWCWDNQITKLILPDNIKCLAADLDIANIFDITKDVEFQVYLYNE